MFATNPGSLSSIAGTHIVEGWRADSWKFSSDPHARGMACIFTTTQKYTQKHRGLYQTSVLLHYLSSLSTSYSVWQFPMSPTILVTTVFCEFTFFLPDFSLTLFDIAVLNNRCEILNIHTGKKSYKIKLYDASSYHYNRSAENISWYFGRELLWNVHIALLFFFLLELGCVWTLQNC